MASMKLLLAVSARQQDGLTLVRVGVKAVSQLQSLKELGQLRQQAKGSGVGGVHMQPAAQGMGAAWSGYPPAAGLLRSSLTRGWHASYTHYAAPTSPPPACMDAGG